MVADLNKLVLFLLNIGQSVASLAEFLDAGRAIHGQASQAAIAWGEL